MKCFGLTPDAVLARAGAAGAVRPPPEAAPAMGLGALGLGAVSTVAYSIWAYRLAPGEGVMYAAIAAVFLGLGGLALAPLVAGPGVRWRFTLLFAALFAAYAALWCAWWFGLRGRYHADLYGSALGLAAVVRLLQRAFGRRDGFWAMFGVLFSCHTLGYTLGDDLHAWVRGPAGRLLWGAAHGTGFGAGLGYVLARGQQPLRARLGRNDAAR